MSEYFFHHCTALKRQQFQQSRNGESERERDRERPINRERESGMKQRIRGLVSLHEIPFSSCALQREEGNWPRYTKRGSEGGVGGGGERQTEIAKILLDPSLLFFFVMFPHQAALRAASPVTSHLSIQEACFFFTVTFLI